MQPVARRLRRQADQCGALGSELMRALLDGAADDADAGGVVAELLTPHAGDQAGSALALRLAASLHRLVLERQAPELALHYPSVGGTAPVEQVWPAAARACAKHRDRLRELLPRPVQTNEVGRAAVLIGVLAHATAATGRPVRLLEVGSSAGLNLRADAFRYDVDGTPLGDPDSPVRLVEPWAAGPRPPAADLRVVARAGCDPDPLDPTTPEGRLVLTSCVWADQLERFERLRGALALAEQVPAAVVRAGAADWLRAELAAAADGAVTVVWHSVVRQYVPPAEREQVEQLLADAGRRATASAPLVHAFLEPERDGNDVAFRVRARRWPDGEPVHLADAHPHGPPVRWTGRLL